MLPPRSLDQSCPESHARCEPSWLSPRRNSCVLPFFQLIFPLSLFSLVALPLMTFPGSMRVITPEGGRERATGGRRGRGRGGSEGFHRMRRRRLADAKSSARSLMIPRL